jgi:hypothetical protein
MADKYLTILGGDSGYVRAPVERMEELEAAEQERDRLLEAVKDLNFGILGTQTGVAGRDDATKAAVLWERAQAGYTEMHGLYKLALEIEKEKADAT